MLHKVFTSLPRKTIVSQKTFPSVRLGKQLATVTDGCQLRRSCGASLSLPQLQLDSAFRDDGDIVEVRSTHADQLLALAFVNTSQQRLDIFHTHDFDGDALFPLPAIDEGYFQRRFSAALDKRLDRLCGVQRSTCFRAFHGAADGVPGLYVDHYSTSYVSIYCESLGAERLLSTAATFYRDRGAEQLLLRSPSIPEQVISLVTPTTLDAKRSEYYQEGVNQFLWLPLDTKDTPQQARFLLDPQLRRTRKLLQDVARGMKVCCVQDTAAGTTLACSLQASSVMFVQPDSESLHFAKKNLLLNHGKEAFAKVSCVASLAEGIERLNSNNKAVFDLISVEVRDAPVEVSVDQCCQWMDALARTGLLVVQFSRCSLAAVNDVLQIVQSAAQTRNRRAEIVTVVPGVCVDFPEPLWNTSLVDNNTNVSSVFFRLA